MKEPNFLRPEILVHPTIPKPMHGINPRTIKGKSWWDVVRKEAAAENNNCCWACGVHKSRAMFHKWLEGHECYDIDYETGRIEMRELTSLCHACHNFIHSGRVLSQCSSGIISPRRADKIFRHGFSILNDAGITPHIHSMLNFLLFQNRESEDIIAIIEDRGYSVSDLEKDDVAWQDWHLIVDGEKHFSPFKDYKAWYNYYLDEQSNHPPTVRLHERIPNTD